MSTVSAKRSIALTPNLQKVGFIPISKSMIHLLNKGKNGRSVLLSWRVPHPFFHSRQSAKRAFSLNSYEVKRLSRKPRPPSADNNTSLSARNYLSCVSTSACPASKIYQDIELWCHRRQFKQWWFPQFRAIFLDVAILFAKATRLYREAISSENLWVKSKHASFD